MGASDRYAASRALYRRAETLIPGATHLSGRPLLDPETSPLYFERGRGGRIWDVDGHEYIDLIMAYGPFLLGYAHPEVDAAVMRQADSGILLSLNHPLHHRFLNAVLARFPGAQMGSFFKTGSEATTAAVRIARRATGRKAVARCGYHGWHDWCLPLEDFVPEGLASEVREYQASRPETLEALLAAEPGRFAAVILAPEMIHPPDRAKVIALMEAARRHGALFIMDEVKTGLRAPAGSMQAFYGVTPDMTCLSKALGNGWPIAAVIGRAEVIRTAAGLHLSATYHGETAGMAAALATLEIIDRDGVTERVAMLGERLIVGLNAVAARHGAPARAYGEPIAAMPFLAFEGSDAEMARQAIFARVIERGVLMHPRHMGFLCAAHTEADIDRVIGLVDEAMGAVIRAGLTNS